ncbi:hypothetical protein [Bacillus infantis]|uniref:hypothetical protein n=1 Tax=Bacillus infantis TaxID=324767 RepID=UPI00209DD775|nr:hypothetical protein [Bacillus infantis]MCP1161198.1 hypothetical protein [Bacillus infantis]
MTKIIEAYFGFIFAVLLMITALAYTFWSMTDWPDTYELIPSAQTVFIEDTKIPVEPTWSGNQVVAKLYRLNDENVQIEVDGQLFQYKSDFMNNQHSISLEAQYKKQLILNDTGAVEKIIFTIQ